MVYDVCKYTIRGNFKKNTCLLSKIAVLKDCAMSKKLDISV